MKTILAAAMSALVIASCASGHESTGPEEVRQALAPTGKLRVALFATNVVHVAKDPVSGEMKGVSHDLGRELAERLGVPFAPVLYSEFPALLDAGKAGAWDVAFIGANAERREFLDFTGNYLRTEIGYLVPAGSAIRAPDEVDRAGVRVAVVARGTPDVELTRAMKGATLVRVPGMPQALELVKSGKAEALAALKPVVLGVAAKMPGARVLDAPGSDEAAMAMPKGRGPLAAAFGRRFIEDAKRDGRVKAAIDRAALRGVVVASRE